MALLILGALMVSQTALGQNKKSQRLFDEGNYGGVIDSYTSNYTKGLDPPDIRLFASSMLRMGLVVDAFDITQQSYVKHPDDPDIVLAMVECMLYNGDYSGAYYLLEEKKELDFVYEEVYPLAKRAAILKRWEEREHKYDVTPLSEFNTDKNESSLYLVGEKRIFCSSESKDDIAREKYDRGKREYSSLYQAMSDTLEREPFASGKFKGRFNIGQFEISQGELYFTFSEESINGENELQIFKTDAENPSLERSEAVSLVPIEYSVAHPTFSPNGDRMIFASDIPGGEGGMDLYYSVRTQEGWSAPISLGDVVNTPGNEVFPRLIDGQIYFSSNGHPGYGGQDIFVVTDDMFREDLRNLYAPINSAFDDFGYLRTGESTGYFTSDRPGGKGGDDIFKYEKSKVQPDPRLISGIIEMEGMPQKNVKMVLMNADGMVVEEAYTDVNGVFYFNRDPEGGKYSFKIDALKETIAKTDLYLTDNKGRKGKKLKADKNGNFVFELLALDDFFVDYMQVDDNTLFAFTLHGQIFRDSPGDFDQELGVSMLDERGIVKKSVKTDAHGYFQMEHVVPEDRYWFHVDSDDEDIQMAVLDKNDQILEIIKRDENGRFFYNRPFNEGESISLYNEENELITIQKDEAINLPNILYDLNSWELREVAKQELDRLVELLKNNRNLRIELSSHTDSRGEMGYNEQLSSKRARAAWAYIVDQGIDPGRIEAIGRGETSPVNSCRDGVQCTEEQHALNRRTEFRILSN